MEHKDKIERLKNGLEGHSLVINRVPPEERRWFIGFAKNDCVDDYGIALMKLITEYRRIRND